MTTIEAHALAVAVEERIVTLVKFHEWYIRNPWARGQDWDEMRRDDAIELRALVRLARKARKASSAGVDRMDPVTAAGGYHSWQAAGPR